MRRFSDIAYSFVSTVVLAAALALVATGCGLIDEWRTDCPEDLTLYYKLDLVTNKDTEMDAKLGTVRDRPLRRALEDYLKDIFVGVAHDVDLSFYDQRQQGERTVHLNDVMESDQRVYEVHLPELPSPGRGERPVERRGHAAGR